MDWTATVFIPGPVKALPTGDRLTFFPGGEKLLESPQGDKVFFCRGLCQVDPPDGLDVQFFPGRHSSVVYVFSNSDLIEVMGDKLLSIQRGPLRVEFAPDNESTIIISATYT